MLGALSEVSQCATCGVEFSVHSRPEICPICVDERQHLPADGRQRWVGPGDFDGRLDVIDVEPGVVSVRVDGMVGIGQEAKVILTDHGTVMVDVPAAITAEAVAAIRALGPMRAIIPSHPHMFGLQSVWAEALGGVPVWVTRADAGWLGRRPDTVHLWTGTETVVPGVTVAVLGGHFPGSAVVHWVGRDGAGVLFTGDTMLPNPDGATVSFMRSYPNRLPLSGAVALRVAHGAAGFAFDRLYGNFDRGILGDARHAVLRSAQRHAEWTGGRHDALTVEQPAEQAISAAHAIRLARPTRSLQSALRFWVDGVGLTLFGQKYDDRTSTRLAFLGPSGAGWHLELVEDDTLAPHPTEENVLVIYLDGPLDPLLVDRIERCGGRRTPALNPYWTESGVTFLDEDGYQLVLTTRRTITA